MDDRSIDAVVIGAGVVGLAVARALALAGREVVVVEAASAIGTHTSSRNSEVIHAGIYYPTGSLKARLCVAGKQLLYDYCARNDVAHRRLGKLLVATTGDEIAGLESYKQQAAANGVNDLTWVTADEARALEPSVRCVRGLMSPSTGIVSSHELMRAFERDARARGADLALESPVTGGAVSRDGLLLEIGGRAPTSIRCHVAINAAGLYAQSVARSIDGHPARHHPRLPLRQGALLRPVRSLPVPAPRLSARRRGRPRGSCDAGSRRASALRPRRQVVVSTASTTGSMTAAAPVVLCRHPPLLARAARRGPCSPATPGIRPKLGPAGTTGARLRDPGTPRSTAFPAWSTSTASSRPA